MDELAASLKNIRQRIAQAAARAGRNPESVTLLGVSKGQPAEKVLAAARLGLRDFGENYVQEWQKKRADLERADAGLAAQLRWHFIGHLQSNKADLVVGETTLIHGVDSLKLATKIAALAQRRGLRQAVLLEVNLEGEASKAGLAPEELPRLLPALAALPQLDCRGLMAIPPALEAPEASRPYFRRLKSLLDECNRTGFFPSPWTELSMGMSHDFEVAVEEGATLVRVGTALFGPRSG
ncbi:MAG: YggS family pyridoxal phosphate-dependent enzyme [bacterium]